MSNLGYFQLKSSPGVWRLRLVDGKVLFFFLFLFRQQNFQFFFYYCREVNCIESYLATTIQQQQQPPQQQHQQRLTIQRRANGWRLSWAIWRAVSFVWKSLVVLAKYFCFNNSLCFVLFRFVYILYFRKQFRCLATPMRFDYPFFKKISELFLYQDEAADPEEMMAQYRRMFGGSTSLLSSLHFIIRLTIQYQKKKVLKWMPNERKSKPKRAQSDAK